MKQLLNLPIVFEEKPVTRSCREGYRLEQNENGEWVCNKYETRTNLANPLDLVIYRDMSSSISGLNRPHTTDVFPARNEWDFAPNYPDITGYDNSIFDEGQPLRGGIYNGLLIDELQESRNFILAIIEGFREYIENGDVRVCIAGFGTHNYGHKILNGGHIRTYGGYVFNTDYNIIIDIVNGMEQPYIDDGRDEGTKTVYRLDSITQPILNLAREDADVKILTITDGVPDDSFITSQIEQTDLNILQNNDVIQSDNISHLYNLSSNNEPFENTIGYIQLDSPLDVSTFKIFSHNENVRDDNYNNS